VGESSDRVWLNFPDIRQMPSADLMTAFMKTPMAALDEANQNFAPAKNNNAPTAAGSEPALIALAMRPLRGAARRPSFRGPSNLPTKSLDAWRLFSCTLFL
jgi:hypothetical protein